MDLMESQWLLWFWLYSLKNYGLEEGPSQVVGLSDLIMKPVTGSLLLFW